MSYESREISIFAGQPYELYLFEMAGQSWRLTSGEKIRYLGGQPCTPTPIRRSSIAKGGETSSNTNKVTMPRDHEIAQLFVGFTPPASMSLTIYRGHEGDSEIVVQFVGAVMHASFDEDCELECAPEERILSQRIPRIVVQAPCNKIIYSTACGAHPEDFKTDATVTGITGAVVTAAEFGGPADGWFTNGYLQKGYFRRMIIRHVGTDLTLIQAIPGLAADDAVTAFAGCARTFAACKDKFTNGPNFMGFPWIPLRNPFKGLEY